MQNHKKEKNFFVFFTKKTDRIPVKGPACLIFWLFCNDFFCFFVEEVHIVAGNFEGHLLSGEIFSAFRLCQEFILTDTEADIRRIIDLLASDEFPCDLTVLSVLCRATPPGRSRSAKNGENGEVAGELIGGEEIDDAPYIRFRVGENEFLAKAEGGENLTGKKMPFKISGDNVYLFDKETEKIIAE